MEDHNERQKHFLLADTRLILDWAPKKGLFDSGPLGMALFFSSAQRAFDTSDKKRIKLHEIYINKSNRPVYLSIDLISD